MKLCIIQPDGSSAETLFHNTQPSLDKINSELLLFENYLYKLIIRDNELIESVELFVGDYSVPLIYNMATGCYESDRELIFGGCFDLTYVSINIDEGNGEERVYYTDYLRVATTKQTAKQVEKMLGEIEQNLPNFLEVCFSRSRKQSGLIKNDIRSIWNTLNIVDEIVNIYEGSYGYFCNHKKSSVDQVAAIVDVRAMKKIDQDSLIWIASNPDNLLCSDKEAVIKIQDQNYVPSKIKTYVSQYSYDVYENKVVLGFLKSVIIYLEKQIEGFNREILELENIPETIVLQLPNTHELTGRCIFIYYKGVVDKYRQRLEILQDLYFRYERALDCKPEVIFATPKLTNTFKQVYHYRLCFECMVKWFELGDYSFNHLNYLFKLKTLSRIFEYYCLIKLQAAIVHCGYAYTEGSRVLYDLEDDIEEINNQYKFIGKGQEITLLYEPSIWANKMSEEINLYSTGYNFSKCKWNDRWTPDFVIKIKTNVKEYYYILDAKYSNAQNVKKRYIPELVLKYSTQIASKDKFFSDVIGVGALYPNDLDKMIFFKKNGVNSKKQSLPKYFSLTIVGDEQGNSALSDRIEGLLNVIDSLEEEIRPANVEHDFISNANESSDINDINVNDVTEDETKKEVQNAEISDDLTSVEINLVNVNGKKCFYNARGMCLCLHSRCTINDEPCDRFINKSSKKLLLEEDTCRNFIRYLRKGKVDRVECAVSGLPGCVGTEECQFCLKKKGSKAQ